MGPRVLASRLAVLTFRPAELTYGPADLASGPAGAGIQARGADIPARGEVFGPSAPCARPDRAVFGPAVLEAGAW
jgi:hypothetical protein